MILFAEKSCPPQVTLKRNARRLGWLVVIESAVLPEVRASASPHKEAKGGRTQLPQVWL